MAFVTNPLESGKVVVTDSEGVKTTSNITLTELNRIDGLTSNAQQQLNEKAIKGFGTNPENNQVAYVTSEGKLHYSGNIGQTELGSLLNIESNIQDQINSIKSQSTSFSMHDVYPVTGEVSKSIPIYTESGFCYVRFVAEPNSVARVIITAYEKLKVSYTKGQADGWNRNIVDVDKDTSLKMGISKSITDDYESGDILISLQNSSLKKVIRLTFHMHNNDSDEFAFCGTLHR